MGDVIDINSKKELVEIAIDENNQNNLKALNSMINEATQKYQITVQAILNFNRVKGEWGVSPDGSKLVKVKKDEGVK